MAFFIFLVKDRVNPAKCLDEHKGRERGSMRVEIIHQSFTCSCQQKIVLEAGCHDLVLRLSRRLEGFERVFELINPLEALHNRVHVTCVSEVV